MLKQATFALVTLGGLVLAAPRRAEAQLSDEDKKGIQAVTDRWLVAAHVQTLQRLGDRP